MAPWDSSFKCCEWGTRTSPSSTESPLLHRRRCYERISSCFRPVHKAISPSLSKKYHINTPQVMSDSKSLCWSHTDCHVRCAVFLYSPVGRTALTQYTLLWQSNFELYVTVRAGKKISFDCSRKSHFNISSIGSSYFYWLSVYLPGVSVSKSCFSFI